MFIAYTVLGVIVILCMYFVTTYNSLVRNRNLVKEAWSSIDVQLKRRYDLIPNILETVKGYATHEKGVFEQVAKIRAKTMGIADDPKEKMQAENALTTQLRSVFAIAENYPELKANENFIALQRQLAEIEEQIQFARRYYNGAARNYNIQIQSFPSNIVAVISNHKSQTYFEMESSSEKINPEVKF